MANRRISCVLLVGLFTIFNNSICDEASDDEWESFKSTYSKSYESEAEEAYRKSIYMENKKLIDQHNELYYDGLVSYELALNAYSDLTDSEFSSQMKGHKHYVGRRKRYNFLGASGTLFTGSSNATIPEHIDWRDKGAVTEVKNQNPCGSCYAFAAAGSIESQYFIKTGKLVTFSEQNLIDCSHPYGNAGCDGGWIDFAFQYIKENVGIAVEAKYPYEAKDNVCRYDPKSSGTAVSDYVFIPEGDEKKLTEAIATVGPISVYIDATGWAFRHLSEGIYSNENCNPNHLDHAVLAIGYGTNENGQDYYIVKNSWGRGWGQDGFIKMARNKNNSCGIATSAVYPII